MKASRLDLLLLLLSHFWRRIQANMESRKNSGWLMRRLAALFSEIGFVFRIVVIHPLSTLIEITTIVGCRNLCVACPQAVFVNSYVSKPNRPKAMSFDDFKKLVDAHDRNTCILFGGYSEPFAHPQCVEMVEYALRKCWVGMNTTLVGLSPEGYDRFRDHPKFCYLFLHLPDADGMTKISMDEEYLAILGHVIKHKPRYAMLLSHLHAAREHPKISHIISCADSPLIYTGLHDRAGNVKLDHPDIVVRKEPVTGALSCSLLFLDAFKKGSGHVLPDGTTVICTCDWSIEAVIGNGFVETVPAMRSSSAYQVIQSACRDPNNVDVICRKCFWAAPQRTS